MKRKQAAKRFFFFPPLLAFLLITIAVLTGVGIYCYLIKYQAKQKHLLPFQLTNIKLNEITN